MENTIDINSIVNQIEKLDYNGKINILSRIVSLLKHEKKSETNSITQLKGLGKDLWNNIDINSYLSEERESWE